MKIEIKTYGGALYAGTLQPADTIHDADPHREVILIVSGLGRRRGFVTSVTDRIITLSSPGGICTVEFPYKKLTGWFYCRVSKINIWRNNKKFQNNE